MVLNGFRHLALERGVAGRRRMQEKRPELCGGINLLEPVLSFKVLSDCWGRGPGLASELVLFHLFEVLSSLLFNVVTILEN
jgi:hypothetical protein